MSLRWKYSASYSDIDKLDDYPVCEYQSERDDLWTDLEGSFMDITLKRDRDLKAVVKGHLGLVLNLRVSGRMPSDGDSHLEGYFIFSKLFNEQEVRHKLKLPYGQFKPILNVDNIIYHDIVFRCHTVETEGFFNDDEEAKVKRWKCTYDSNKADFFYLDENTLIQDITDFTKINDIQSFVLKICDYRKTGVFSCFHAHMFVIFKEPKSKRQLNDLLHFMEFKAASGFDRDNYNDVITACFQSRNIFSKGFF